MTIERRRHVRKLYKEKLKSKGICTSCCKDKATIRVTCQRCLLQKRASKHLGSSKKWKQLYNLFKLQKGRCYYTQEELTIGINDAIDHIRPRSKKGDNHISNLCFTSRRVNAIKSNLEIDELIKLCRKVLINFGYLVMKHDDK